MAPRVGLEPTTYRLTAECSTVELPWNVPFLREPIFILTQRLFFVNENCMFIWLSFYQLLSQSKLRKLTSRQVGQDVRHLLLLLRFHV